MSIMTTHAGLSHAISFHPHTFHLDGPGSEDSAPRSDANSASRRAKSTSYEERIPSLDDHDPISRHHSSLADVESTHIRQYDRETDPYQLSSKLKPSSELKLIRANTSRKRDIYGLIAINKKARQARGLQKFYETQNENIERWLRPVDEHIRLAKQFEGDNQLKYKIAVQGSLIANLVLAALQLYAAISSGSLSLLATMSDAIFDPMSNLTLMICNGAAKKVDPRTFPSGKARIETAGNIFFCFLMTSVSFIIIVLSVEELVNGSDVNIKRFHLPSVIAVAIAFCTKLALFLYCWALRKAYSQVRILWEDHRNDLLINGFGLLTSIGGSRLKWWIDAAGAIILATVVSSLWLRTAYGQFQLLIGITADTPMQQWITYICMLLPTAPIVAFPFLNAPASFPLHVVIFFTSYLTVASHLQITFTALPPLMF
jgi:divalent metal cation (Fe/Co/Zn/Cd) transporter